MATRNKKPKCTSANKACGMVCKPKAAICADQRKKLVTNAKKSGLKGQAAKDYVQARIDRYKKLVDNKGAGGVGSGKKPTDTVTRTPIMNTAIKPPSFDGTRNPKNATPKMDELKANVIARFSAKGWDMILKASVDPLEERFILSKVAPAARVEFQAFLERFIKIEGLDESNAEADYLASIPKESREEARSRQKIAKGFLPDPTNTATRTPIMSTPIKPPSFDGTRNPKNTTPYTTNIVDTDSVKFSGKAAKPSPLLSRKLANGVETKMPIVLETSIDNYKVVEGGVEFATNKAAGKEQQNVLITKTRAEAASMALQRQEFNKAGVGVGNKPLNPLTTIVDLDSLYGTKSSAPKDTIDKIARLIVSSGRLTDFPTVQKTGLDRYKLKEGSAVVLAYKRARELDPSLPDRILVRTEV